MIFEKVGDDVDGDDGDDGTGDADSDGDEDEVGDGYDDADDDEGMRAHTPPSNTTSHTHGRPMKLFVGSLKLTTLAKSMAQYHPTMAE